jgi:Dyp-type peroxidase family
MTTNQKCPVDIEYGDLQGNVLTAYGRLGFPYGCFGVLTVNNAAAGRALVERLRPRVTTALRWPSRAKDIPEGRKPVERPLVTINLAFTFRGLLALGVPTRTLRGMPDEFIDGMAARCAILGDDTPENPKEDWDRVWGPDNAGRDVHILVMLNSQMNERIEPAPELAALCAEIEQMCAQTDGGVAMRPGHRGADEKWQHLGALKDSKGLPCPKEHFGYTDGISDPVFLGQYPNGEEQARSVGSGATDGEGKWRPLATGEFLLGWADEAQEIAGAAMPLDFSRNGTFFAYRKLHQDIDAFHAWADESAGKLQTLWKLGSFEEAKETLLAKMAGRWSDGVPLMAAPDYAAWQEFNRKYPPDELHRVRTDSDRSRLLVDYGYRDDLDGIKCPATAHVRRTNTRDMLDPRASAASPKSRMGSTLNNRRRLLRRGLPYGSAKDPNGEHGIVMLAVCSSLQRQFEFVQQQWINYGLDSNAGNDTDPVIGNHGPSAKFVIPADPASGNPPFICTRLPQWVQTRGGGYFFMPSMTALRMIGMGTVDPT